MKNIFYAVLLTCVFCHNSVGQGFVGIGTNSPTHMLDVAGDINFSGSLGMRVDIGLITLLNRFNNR